MNILSSTFIRIMNFRIVFLCSISFICCKPKCEQKYYWVGSRNRQPYCDTVYFCQSTIEKNDSTIIECNTGGHYSDTFIFNKLDKKRAFYSGRPGSKGIYCKGRLIQGASKTTFSYEGDTVVIVNQAKLLVYKYHYDEENTFDVGCNYYWVPDIGIIYFSSTAWNVSYRLFTNDAVKDSVITDIVSIVKNWQTHQQ